LACVPTAPPGLVVAAPEVRLGDCATAEQGLEFAPLMIEDFEAQNGANVATYMYTYTDNTSAITPNGYEPATEVGTHCASDPGQRLFHFHSTPGPFLGWGGGLGVSMLHLNVGNGAATIPDSILDVSQWDGVAVWARRGTNSQPLLRVLVGNKYTDDDVSFLMYLNDPTQARYCERVRECACINGLDCTFSKAPLDNNGYG
jgi:hypothetical protein